MADSIRILGCPVLPLDKGLEDDGITFGVRVEERRRGSWVICPTTEIYSKQPFSFVLADELVRDLENRTGCPSRFFEFRISAATIEQIRKDLENGAYRL